MPIDLYYMPGSAPCHAVQLTTKLLGVNVNLKFLNLSKGEQLAPEFIKVNPQHTIPTLVDDDFVLWESCAIIIYLAERYGKENSLYPKDVKRRALVNQRLYFNMSTLYDRFGEYYYPIVFENATPDPAKHTKMEEAFKFLETFLEGHEFAVGNNLTVADISLVATVTMYDVAKFDMTPYKNISKWYGRMKEILPGFEQICGKDMLTELFKQYAKKP
ncbi:hypothetical protein ILUMI_25245 [Ignelater luminosus]|uniref:Uncharacterized protein n=1 Tax=Ignelater luminosus TaxID=2038154 RepID=A0A8K0C8W8_IGNLU|nr:hypothetical protein ILUMI_25245 [Ignelater luminosus]